MALLPAAPLPFFHYSSFLYLHCCFIYVHFEGDTDSPLVFNANRSSLPRKFQRQMADCEVFELARHCWDGDFSLLQSTGSPVLQMLTCTFLRIVFNDIWTCLCRLFVQHFLVCCVSRVNFECECTVLRQLGIRAESRYYREPNCSSLQSNFRKIKSSFPVTAETRKHCSIIWYNYKIVDSTSTLF